MDHTDNQQRNSDEITLKELILKIQDFWKELWRNWWLIGLICLPFLGYFVYKAAKTPSTFAPEIKFIVEGQNGGNLSGLGGFLGAFGFGRSSGGNINPYKISEVAKSKDLMKEVLFSKSASGDFLANDIIEIYEMDLSWKEDDPSMEGFRFVHDSLEIYGDRENVALLSIFRKVLPNKKGTNNPLVVLEFNDESGAFLLSAKSIDEDLSLALAKLTYDKLKYFFEERVLDEKIVTRDLLKFKTDSIQNLINSQTTQLAYFEDTNRGLVSKSAQIKKSKILNEIKGLTTAFAETIRNYEIADFTLKSSKPLFLIIDYPISPISAETPSIVRSIIIGGIVGGAIACFIVFARYSYRNVMNQ